MGSCATAGARHATRGDKPHREETSPEGGAGVQGWREALAGPEGRHGRGDTEMALRTGAFSRGATSRPFSTPSSLSCRRLFLITPREHSEADASDIYFLLRARPAQVTAGGTFLNERRKMSEQRSAATHPTDSRMSGNNTRIRFASAGRAYHPPVRRGELTVRRAEVCHQGSPRRAGKPRRWDHHSRNDVRPFKPRAEAGGSGPRLLHPRVLLSEGLAWESSCHSRSELSSVWRGREPLPLNLNTPL